MVSWLRLSIAFFVLVLVLTGVAYFFGPQSLQQAFRENESPVGQLSTSGSTAPPPQPPADPHAAEK